MNIKKICGYPHGCEYKYETNIYPAGRVRESYYPYPIRSVDISTH